MKAWVIGKQAGLESLEMKEHDAPIAGYGEAVIAVKACALNHRDLMIVSNRYGGPKPQYRIPLSDMAGEVVSVGEGAAKVKPGDRVSAAHFTAWIDGDWEPEYLNNDLGNSADGVLAERIVVPAHCLFKLPKNLTYEKGATLPVAGATVWSCVQKLGGIKAGDTVLLLGTGGVSVFGLQIAKMNGARAVITSSSDEKLERMKILGADITINYRSNPEWEREVIEKTGGVDIVVETGGTGTLGQSMSSCAPNGRIGLIGALSQGEQPRLSNLLGKNLVLKGITSGSRRMLQDFVNAIEVNGLDPVIDRVFDFDQARQAYDHLDSGSHIGKVVIKI